jgi:hypothetical protein
MRCRFIILTLILIFLNIGCKNKSTENKKLNDFSTPGVINNEKKPVPVLSTQSILDSNSEIVGIIENFEERTSHEDTIYYIKKLNMGIPGGDNWFVSWFNGDEEWSSSLPFIYIINDTQVTKRYDDPIFSLSNPLDRITFDIMADIPGERIGEGAAAIYDYNEDGYDEILSFSFGGMWDTFTITGYDANGDRLVNYCKQIFNILDKANGPPPIKFMTYNGLDGIQFENYDAYGKQELSFYYWKNNPTRLVQLEIYEPE